MLRPWLCPRHSDLARPSGLSDVGIAMDRAVILLVHQMEWAKPTGTGLVWSTMFASQLWISHGVWQSATIRWSYWQYQLWPFMLGCPMTIRLLFHVPARRCERWRYNCNGTYLFLISVFQGSQLVGKKISIILLISSVFFKTIIKLVWTFAIFTPIIKMSPSCR